MWDIVSTVHSTQYKVHSTQYTPLIYLMAITNLNAGANPLHPNGTEMVRINCLGSAYLMGVFVGQINCKL